MTLIKKIHIVKYRKLKDIDFEFSNGINVISGTNGTCKTSLLHIISNSYQAVTKGCDWVREKDCLDVIRQINNTTNPKIESLTKGDKTYNDPSNGLHGALFSVDYINHTPLEFRKHNSKMNNRYAVKPWYRPETSDSLPYCPVIYLGLTRLFPFGEYSNDESVEKLKKNLPDSYQTEIADIYRKLTGIRISSVHPQKMGEIKTRADFGSDTTGIDSNTISAGEDNLFIIIGALASLHYYYDSIDSKNEIESVLLIDEFDATLHPSLQLKLLDILHQCSQDYKIQIVFTTHSLSVLEYTLRKKDNVTYLIDNENSVIKMDNPDIYTIKMYLYDSTKDNIYLEKAIPIFTEDEEARSFLKVLFDYFQDKYDEFAKVIKFFHIVDAKMGADNLKSIFNDQYLIQTTMKYICILDGDQKENLNNYIITLPGGASPEKVIMNYALFLYDNDSDFWKNETILSLGYGKVHFRDNIKPQIENITKELNELHLQGKKTHGVEREKRKRVFNSNKRFFELLFKCWTYDDENSDAVNTFYKRLNIMFKKVSAYYGINPGLWTIK